MILELELIWGALVCTDRTLDTPPTINKHDSVFRPHVLRSGRIRNRIALALSASPRVLDE